MKKYISLLIAILITILLYTSCGKTGDVGPKGATGSQGLVGPAGPTGADGKAGSAIYSGSTVPLSSTGVTGDYYLDIATGLLYGPKTASGWGTGFSLAGSAGATGATGATGAKGATGATGTAGSAILSGTGIPAASLGNTGDFYLDTNSYLLYGPKLTNGWGTATSLQGPAGAVQVMYSGWNEVTDVRDSLVNGTIVNLSDLSAPALNQSIIDGGIMKVYMTNFDGSFILPVSESAIEYVTISFIPRKGHFIITLITEGNTVLKGAYEIVPSTQQFRYVLIPGGKSLAVKNHVDLGNYEAVRKYFRLRD